MNGEQRSRESKSPAQKSSRLEKAGDEKPHNDQCSDSQSNHEAREYMLHSAMSGDIRRRFRRMLYKPQGFGCVRLGHHRSVFAASPAMLNPRRVLVTGYADAKVEGAAAQPTEKNILVGQFAAVLTFLFSE